MIVSICNHKGGVGKTCSTVNIGAAIARHGKKVCLVDLDPQSNLTTAVGISEPDQTIYGALKGGRIQPTKITENLFVIPSDIDLSAAEMELSAEPGREYLVKEILNQFSADFSLVLIDCPPSLGLLTINALTAADFILIPLQAEFLALKGLTKLSEVIDKIQRRLNPKLEIAGVFLTQYDSRKTLNRRVLETAEAKFTGKVFKTPIRTNIAIAEAPAAGKDIFSYLPKSNGAEDYELLTKEIMEYLKL